MRSPGINGEGELRGQLANPGSPGKMAVKMECACVLENDMQSDSVTNNTVGQDLIGCLDYSCVKR